MEGAFRLNNFDILLLKIRSQCAVVALPKDFGWLKEDLNKIEEF